MENEYFIKMANQLKKTRTITDKVSVKGVLSEDGATISYMNDKEESNLLFDGYEPSVIIRFTRQQLGIRDSNPFYPKMALLFHI